MGLGDVQLRVEPGDGIRGHRGAAVGVHGTWLDAAVDGDGVLDEFLRQGAGLGLPDLPVNDLARVDVEDDIQQVPDSPRESWPIRRCGMSMPPSRGALVFALPTSMNTGRQRPAWCRRSWQRRGSPPPSAHPLPVIRCRPMTSYPGRSRTRTACSVPVFLTGAESLGSGRQVQWSAEPIACDGPQGRH